MGVFFLSFLLVLQPVRILMEVALLYDSFVFYSHVPVRLLE